MPAPETPPAEGGFVAWLFAEETMSWFNRALKSSLVISICLSGLFIPTPAGESDAAATGASTNEALVVQAEALLQTIAGNRADFARLGEQRDRSEGEDRVLAERRLLRKGLETLASVDAFVENVLEQEKQGIDASVFRASAEELVSLVAPMARQRIGALSGEIATLGAQRASTSGEELVSLELQVGRRNEKLTTILEAALDNEQHMANLGLPTEGDAAYLAETLGERAEVTSERIRLALEQISTLEGRLSDKPDDAELKTALSSIELKLDSNRTDLEKTIAMMNRLALPTAAYQKLMIESSGQISADILDTDVALGLLQQWLAGLKDWAIESGPQLFFKTLVFLAILSVFRILARLTRRVVGRAVSSSKLQFSQLLREMFVSVSANMVMVVGLLVALSQLGFALGPLLTGLGIMGFIVGFALQDTLGNFAAGMMILVYRPFDVGDMVEAAGVFGQVSAMSMVSTTVLTIDHQTLVIPNGKIWGDVIKNVTAQRTRRVDLVFGISYSDDIPLTEKALSEILADHPKVLSDPEPVVKLHALGESSVDFVVRPWCKTEDYWDVHWDVTREVKMRFDREGISIPFPQRDVHFYEERRLASN
jgi:small conductance mechanosensitive channel